MNGPTKVYVVWIDDDIEGRRGEGLFELLNTERLEIAPIRPEELLGSLDKMAKDPDVASRPVLFAVDYNLQDAKGFGPDGGLPVAGWIRSRFADAPMYLFGAKLDSGDSEFVARDWYDRVVSLDTLRELKGEALLYNDACDYYRMRSVLGCAKSPSISDVMALLGAPTSSQNRLERALDDSLRGDLDDSDAGGVRAKGLRVLRFAKWTRDVLLTLPGLLYDELYAATFVGMSEAYFREQQEVLSRSLYSGVFSSTTAKRWWSSALAEIVDEAADTKGVPSANPWESGPDALGVPTGERPCCHVCDGPFPETVGQEMDSRSLRRPVHYACSERDPARSRRPQFDEYRVFITGD